MTKEVLYLKCPSCGESNYKQLNETTCQCNIYGCKTKFFIVDSDISSELNEALHARERYNFKQADEIYINILNKTQDEKVKISCYFGRLLSYFGVIYVKDHNKNTVVTFANYDPEYESIKESTYYNQIINSSYSYLYIDKLEELDKEYKKIKKELEKETVYDVFICVKISNKTILNPTLEGYTVDSNYASRIYRELTKKGLKVFYSEESLSGIDYDAQIYSALMRSKSILVITSKKEYLESAWVQSEWRRWINFIKEDVKERNSLYLFIPNGNHFELPNILKKSQIFSDTLQIVLKLEERFKVIEIENKNEDIEEQLIDAENKTLFGEFEEAESIYKNLCKIAPKDYRPWLGLVDILFELKVSLDDRRYERYINKANELCDDKKIIDLVYSKYNDEILKQKKETKLKNKAEIKEKQDKEETRKQAEEEARKQAEEELNRKNIIIKSKIYLENGQKYLNFGMYPQTVVTDSNIISVLNKISNINSRGYIEYKGNEYKKVTAKPFYTSSTFINGKTIVRDNTYYFKVEPLKWRILESNDGKYKLLSEMIIDNTEFYNFRSTRTINGTTIYPNNYEYSKIRAWLNGYNGTSYNVDNYTNKGFIDIAFTDEEKALINETLVDNSSSSIGYSENPYICNNTTDKIYLLSYSEATNTNYGFSSSILSAITRRATVSDYARSKGCYMSTDSRYYGNGIWWLRSPNYNVDYIASVVHDFGSISDYNVDDSRNAFRAALEITIK